MFAITNTSQFDDWQAIFVHGIKALQHQLVLVESDKPFSLGHITALTRTLLAVGKALSFFLSDVSVFSIPSIKSRFGKGVDSKDAWLSAAIIDLRIECHRYSRTVLQIAHAVAKKGVKARRKKEIMKLETWWKSSDDDERDDMVLQYPNIPTNLISPIMSTSTSTSIQSWWSNSPMVSPSDSMSTASPGSECGDGVGELWECLSDGCVYAGVVWTCATSTSDIDGDYSHW